MGEVLGRSVSASSDQVAKWPWVSEIPSRTASAPLVEPVTRRVVAAPRAAGLLAVPLSEIPTPAVAPSSLLGLSLHLKTSVVGSAPTLSSAPFETASRSPNRAVRSMAVVHAGVTPS